MRNNVKPITRLILLVLLVQTAFGATYTTTGTPGTWDLGGTPSASDDIVINHDWSSHNGVQLANYAGTMTVNSGGYFKMFGSFSVFTGTIDIKSGGTFQVVGGTNLFAGASINIDGAWSVSGSFTNNASSSWTGTGTVSAGNDFTDNTGTSTTGETTCTGCTVTLPVELLMFKVGSFQNKAIIKWRTGMEMNNDYFTIEHSTDGINFESIGRVSGQGNTTEQTDYSYTHHSPNLDVLNYYRLRQIDFDGTQEIFEIQTLPFVQQSKLELHQAGTSQIFSVLGVNETSPLIMEVFSIDGKSIEHKELMGQNSFVISHQGMVVIRLVHDDQVLESKYFIH